MPPRYKWQVITTSVTLQLVMWYHKFIDYWYRSSVFLYTCISTISQHVLRDTQNLPEIRIHLYICFRRQHFKRNTIVYPWCSKTLYNCTHWNTLLLHLENVGRHFQSCRCSCYSQSGCALSLHNARWNTRRVHCQLQRKPTRELPLL